eukprot:791186-Rhodomonas_salina.2
MCWTCRAVFVWVLVDVFRLCTSVPQEKAVPAESTDRAAPAAAEGMRAGDAKALPDSVGIRARLTSTARSGTSRRKGTLATQLASFTTCSRAETTRSTIRLVVRACWAKGARPAYRAIGATRHDRQQRIGATASRARKRSRRPFRAVVATSTRLAARLPWLGLVRARSALAARARLRRVAEGAWRARRLMG